MQPIASTLQVIALYLSPQRGVPGTPVPSLEIVPDEGISGDYHHGPTRVRSTGERVINLRHFTAVAPQDLAAAAESLGVPFIDPAWLNANICFAYTGPGSFTESLEGAALCNAQGRPVLEIKGITEPCLSAGKMIAAQLPHLAVQPELFPKCAHNRRGVYGVALEPTTIRVGDRFTFTLATHW